MIILDNGLYKYVVSFYSVSENVKNKIFNYRIYKHYVTSLALSYMLFSFPKNAVSFI